MGLFARRIDWVYAIGISLAICSAVLISMLASASSPANNKVVVTYYSVTGTSKSELRASLDQQRASEIAVGDYDAHTSWQIDWRFSYDRREHACGIEEMTVTLDARMILPRWDSPLQGKQSLQAAWLHYLDALRAHEDGHIEIARAAKSSIESSISTTPAEEDCAKMGDAVNFRAQAILETFREREAQYDRNTGHGLSQGARFP
jgi:predicted secreted Zn-dependent protease